MKLYYRNYFTSIVMSLATGAIAVMALILISKHGWDAANEYIITTFFVMTAFATYYSASPGVFQQDQNISANKALFIKFDALQDELLSYLTTGEAMKKEPNIGEALKSAVDTSPKPATQPAQGSRSSGTEQHGSRTGIPLTPKEFIHYVDIQLALDTLPIGFDPSQIPNYRDAFSAQ